MKGKTAGDFFPVFFRKTLDADRCPILLFLPDLFICYSNFAASALLCGDAIKITDIINGADENRFLSMLNKLSAAGEQSATERFRDVNGTNWECILSMMTDEHGNICYSCRLQSILQIVAMETELRRTIQETELLIKALDESCILSITDPRGIITHVNEYFCRISKFSREELLGEAHRIVNSHHHKTEYIKAIWATIENGIIWKGQIRNQAKDGSIYWLESTIIPFVNEDGKPYKYVCIQQDITINKKAYDELARSERFIKMITDHLPAMVAYWNPELRCLYANSSYRKWFGKSEHEINNIYMPDLLGKAEYKRSASRIKRVLSGDKQIFDRPVRNPEQSYIAFKQFHYLPDIRDGEVKGYYSLIYDISKLKSTQQELMKRNGEIDLLMRSINDGFAFLDNELRLIYANGAFEKFCSLSSEELFQKYMPAILKKVISEGVRRQLILALQLGKQICIEDYFEPENIWREYRVFPASNGISFFVRDISQAKEKEATLRLLESVIKNTQDAVMIMEKVDHEYHARYKTIYVNAAFSDQTGYTEAEALKTEPIKLIGAETDSSVLDMISENLVSQEFKEICFIQTRKDGSIRWVEASFTPIIELSGKIYKWVVIQKDVTSRKLSELHDHLQVEIAQLFNLPELDLEKILPSLLRVILNKCHYELAELWLLSSDLSRINRISSFGKTGAAERFIRENQGRLSYALHETIFSRSLRSKKAEFWHIDDPDANPHRLDSARKAGLLSGWSFPLIYQDQAIGVLITAGGQEARAGFLMNYVLPDICMSIAAEISRKELEASHRNLFELTPDPIVLISSLGYIRKVNPSLCHILNYEEEELLGLKVDKFLHSDDLLASFIMFSEVLEGRQVPYFENRLLTKSGDPCWLAWTAVPSFEGDTILAIGKNVTEKKLNEIKQEAYIRQIEHQNAKLHEISWIQSHLVRAPLANVQGLVDLLINCDKYELDREDLLLLLKDAACQLDRIVIKIASTTQSPLRDGCVKKV